MLSLRHRCFHFSYSLLVFDLPLYVLHDQMQSRNHGFEGDGHYADSDESATPRGR